MPVDPTKVAINVPRPAPPPRLFRAAFTRTPDVALAELVDDFGGGIAVIGNQLEIPVTRNGEYLHLAIVDDQGTITSVKGMNDDVDQGSIELFHALGSVVLSDGWSYEVLATNAPLRMTSAVTVTIEVTESPNPFTP